MYDPLKFNFPLFKKILCWTTLVSLILLLAFICLIIYFIQIKNGQVVFKNTSSHSIHLTGFYIDSGRYKNYRKLDLNIPSLSIVSMEVSMDNLTDDDFYYVSSPGFNGQSLNCSAALNRTEAKPFIKFEISVQDENYLCRQVK